VGGVGGQQGLLVADALGGVPLPVSVLLAQPGVDGAAHRPAHAFSAPDSQAASARRTASRSGGALDFNFSVSTSTVLRISLPPPLMDSIELYERQMGSMNGSPQAVEKVAEATFSKELHEIFT